MQTTTPRASNCCAACFSVLLFLCLSFVFLFPTHAQNQASAKVVLNKKFKINKRKLKKQLDQLPLFSHSFHGLCVYDVQKKEYVFNYNASKYFMPASNTKIFTLYAALQYIGDKIPGIKYYETSDSVLLWPTGNPLLLHRKLNDSLVFNFLKKQNKALFFSSHHYKNNPLGTGWAWDDYAYSFSAERSALPVFGNLIRYQQQGVSLTVSPATIGQYTISNQPEGFRASRPYHTNSFTFSVSKNNTYQRKDIPFIGSPALSCRLLGDSLRKPIVPCQAPISNYPQATTFYSVQRDSLLKEMMLYSDNFLAEHILLLCADSINNCQNLHSATLIQHILDTQLQHLQQRPRWVDGSGLSRYNLFSPQSMVETLLKILHTYGTSAAAREQLFSLFPTGGQSGTLKHRFRQFPPFIHAKTGTFSNNHNLSGYLVTQSGKLLVFSFMNNHYRASTRLIKQQMDKILSDFYRYY